MNFDDAYANAAHIPEGEAYPARWAAAARAFRDTHALKELAVPYGPAERETFDIFHPSRLARGTVIFVHGGYWKAFGPDDFSHLSAGPLGAGYSVALPGYTLAPEVRIRDMTAQIARAVEAIARRSEGPIHLVGHSAGGHLVARMACADQRADWTGRIARVLAISPLSDLAPLRETTMNEVLGLDESEAEEESPARRERLDLPVTAWVGGAERPAFLDQARGLGAAWGCAVVVEPDRHHFDVIEGLEHPGSPLMQALFEV